jgi:hypothetical protein
LKLVAGPSGDIGWVGAVRFSTDLKKLAVKLDTVIALRSGTSDHINQLWGWENLLDNSIDLQ